VLRCTIYSVFIKYFGDKKMRYKVHHFNISMTRDQHPKRDAIPGHFCELPSHRGESGLNSPTGRIYKETPDFSPAGVPYISTVELPID
jgi:hypothetical protein